jgi:Peptidase family M48
MKNIFAISVISVVLSVSSGPVYSQPNFLDIFKQPQTPQNPSSSTGAPPVSASAEARSELSPDPNCSRPREQFGVAEKLSKFGGTAAGLRLNRLIQSDFEFSKLTREDKELLRYLAQTTVWIPVQIESKLGAIYDTSTSIFGFGGPTLTEDQKIAFEDIVAKLEDIKKTVPDYPSEIKLKFDPNLKDGAFARFGGVILISERFLMGLGDAKTGADFLLSHEVSHVYKRHALKTLQFTLISSEEGWSLAKEILKIATGGAEGFSFFTLLSLGPTIAKLVDFVKSTQLRYGREQELEADGCSKVWLSASGKEPVPAFRSFYQILGALQTYSEEHPTTAERERNFLGNRANTPIIDKGTTRKEAIKELQNTQKKK